MPVKNNAMPDVITQIYPWKKLTIDSLKHGKVPLWNPYSFSGTAHLGNYQTAALSPFNVLFFLTNQIDAWSLLILLQPLLAGLFMYLFLRSLERSQSASTIGSLAFMFCGFIVVWMAYGTLGYSVLWLPLILLAIHKYFRDRSFWYGALISLALALSFFSGHFQISTYAALVSLAYLIFKAWSTKSRPGTLGALLFWVGGILLSSPQLLPSFDAYQNAVRSASFTKGEIIPWQYLVTLVAPDFFGNPVTRNDWFGHYAEWAGFIGVAPLLLAISVFFRKREREELFFFATALVALLFALPTPLTDLLFALHIPVLSTSAASRIIVVASFSISVLSAYGLDGLLEAWKKKEYKPVWFLTIAAIIFLLSVWGLVLIFKSLPVDKLVVAKRNFFFPSLIVVGAIGSLWLGYRRGVLRIAGITILICLTALDMLRFAAKWMPFDPREYVYPTIPAIAFFQQNIGVSRVFGNFGNELATTFGISSIEGYDALYQKRYGEFISSLADGMIKEGARSVVLADKSGKYTEPALELLGVRYLFHRISDGRNVWAYPFWTYPGYQSVYKDDYFEIFENTKAFPRAFLTSSYILAQTDQEIITHLFDATIDRRQTLILEKKPAIEPQAGEGTVTIDIYRPTEIRLNATVSSPKLLFLSDTYDRGWKTYIDGRTTELLRADYDFRAVAVPTGNHIVEFKYQPQSFKTGLIIAMLSLALLILGSIRQLYYAHRVL